VSQSRTVCELCGRAPKTPHEDHCPRSNKSRRRLDAEIRDALAPKLLWAKGPQISLLTNEIVVNPGIPFVKEGKPWFAGGLPRNLKRREGAKATDHFGHLGESK